MKKVMMIVMIMVMFCQPVHADWFSDLKQKTQETESDDPYAVKTIEFGGFTATLAEGWLLMQEPETDDNITTCMFASEGCSLMVRYLVYDLDDPALSSLMIPMFTNALKKGKELAYDESTEIDIDQTTGTVSVFVYEEDGIAKTMVDTAFDTGEGIVDLLYYTEGDMPFFEDYENLLDSIEIK